MRPLVCTDKPEGLPKLRRSRVRQKRELREARIEIRLEGSERNAWINAAGREAYLSVSDWARDRLNSAAALGVHFSSRDQSWNTPQNVIDAIVRVLGRIGLDPCSNENSIVPARHEWRPERDGDSLGKIWTGRGLVFVNPPYKNVAEWMTKCGEQRAIGAELVALIPARTETEWWGEAIESGALPGYWRGRIAFLRGGARKKVSAPFPSALLYWGRRPARFRSMKEIRT